MRKTSQDGGDATSITSGVENEIKKPIIKNKRNSIKRKVQTLSHESDDAVIEPLLQKDKEKPEIVNQSAKFSMIKSKTDTAHKRDSDKDKLLPDNKAKISGLQAVSLSPSTKENMLCKAQPNTSAPLHNHMNTNVFSSLDTTKFTTATKSQILVEIDGCKQMGYNASPLIFTTAKIHTDSKTKQMEPVQVTTVPILSTTELAKPSNNISTIQAIPSTSDTKISDKQKSVPISSNSFISGTNSKYHESKTTSDNKIQNTLVDRAVVVNNSLLKESAKPLSVAADIKGCKSGPNKIEDTLSKSHDACKIGEGLKKDYLSKTSLITLQSDVKNATAISKTPLTDSENISGTPQKPKPEDAINRLDKATGAKKDILEHQEGKIDENANANAVSVSVSVQQPVKQGDLDIKRSPIDTKSYFDSSSKDKTSKDAASLRVSKLLPRQKNTIVEEVGDVILKSKPYSESSSFSNISKSPKDSEGKIFAPPMQSKIFDRDVSNISDKTMPKSSANNIIDTMTTKITTTLANKPTIDFMSGIKSTVAATPQCVVTTSYVSTSTKPTSTKIPLTDTKTKGSIIISQLSSATTSSKPQTFSTVSSTTPPTRYNKVSTISAIKPSDTGVVAQSSAPSKLSAATTVQTPSTIVTPVPSTAKISSTTSSGSSHSSLTSKPSTVKTIVTSSLTTTSAAKPTTTTPAAKSSVSSKKNGPETSEVNKDNKGLKT